MRWDVTVWHGGKVHPRYFPNMAVWIFETAAKHKTMILNWCRIGDATRAARAFDKFVYRLFGICRKTQKDLCTCVGVGNFF